MKIVVDTNIVFSVVLNTNSQIGDILLNSTGTFDFYTCHLLREELESHKSKIIALGGYSEADYAELVYQVLRPLQFISEELIGFEFWQRALDFVREVDMDDIAFIALTEFMDCKLWTGDQKLLKGIRAKGYTNALSTDEVKALRKDLEERG